MTDAVFSRPLSKFENSMAVFGLVIGFSARGRGRLDEVKLRQAVSALHVEHSILGARVRFGAAGFELAVEPGGAPLFEWGSGDVDALAASEDQFITDGNAFGVKVTTEGDRFRITCAGHHAFMDGRHLHFYLTRLFEHYTSVVLGEELAGGGPAPLPEPPEALLAGLGYERLPIADFVREAYKADTAELLLRPRASSDGEADAFTLEDLDELGVVHRRLLLESAETTAFAQAARKHGVSLHALLAAAAILAERSLAGAPETQLIVLRSAVDVRNRVSPPVAPAAATNFSGSTVAVFPTSGDDAPIVWARQVGEQLASDIENGLLPKSILAQSDLIEVTLNARDEDVAAEPGRVFITNVGAFPALALPDGVVIDHIDGAVVAKPSEPLVAMLSHAIQAGQVVPRPVSMREHAYVVLTYGGKTSISLFIVGSAKREPEAEAAITALHEAIAALSERASA